MVLIMFQNSVTQFNSHSKDSNALPSATELRGILERNAHGDGRAGRGWLESYYTSAREKAVRMDPKEISALAEVFADRGRPDLAQSLRRFAVQTPDEIKNAKRFIRNFLSEQASLSPDAREYMRDLCLRERGPWSVRNHVNSIVEDRPGHVTIIVPCGESYFHLPMRREDFIEKFVARNSGLSDGSKEFLNNLVRQATVQKRITLQTSCGF